MAEAAKGRGAPTAGNRRPAPRRAIRSRPVKTGGCTKGKRESRNGEERDRRRKEAQGRSEARGGARAKAWMDFEIAVYAEEGPGG